MDKTVVARSSSQKVGLLIGLVGAGIDAALEEREANKRRGQYSKLSLDDIVKADKKNYSIPYSDLVSVELEKYLRNTRLNINTSRKYGETKWFLGEKWKDCGKVYEKMLLPVSKDRLIVRA